MKIYEGIVEKDDVGYGLVKVRIFGKHSEDKIVLPTDDLQDAHILYPAESNIDEQSYFRTIRNGSRVIVVFRDKFEQQPLVLGSISNVVKEQPDFTKGFSDPNQVHPDTTHLNENTISRLARKEKIDQTIVQTKNNEKLTGITCLDQTFDQPDIPYNAVYPENRVLQTKNHIIEIDDSTGAERIHIYHKSGTFSEISPDGTETTKVKGEKFLSVDQKLNLKVTGNVNLKTDGNVNVDAALINLNGVADFAVKYTALQAQIASLQTQLQAFQLAYNTAVYTIGGVGTTGTTSVPSAPNITIDISSAKVDTVKLP